MRDRFYPIVSGIPHIAEAIIPLYGRDGIFSLLRSLQAIFSDVSSRDLILDLIETKFQQSKNIDRPGRPGMPYWTIFVFSQLRLALNCSYDRLELESHNFLFRNIMGLPPDSIEVFSSQRIADNINHLDEEVIRKINDVVIAFGHSIIPKSKKKN